MSDRVELDRSPSMTITFGWVLVSSSMVSPQASRISIFLPMFFLLKTFGCPAVLEPPNHRPALSSYRRTLLPRYGGESGVQLGQCPPHLFLVRHLGVPVVVALHERD